MQTPWKIIFYYKLGPTTNAQALYEAIFEVALLYKFRGLKQLAVPVNSKILTEAIFDINSHDQIQVLGKTINGQKLKELFITTILLKRLETKFGVGDHFCVVVPESEGSCDTAVMVAKSGSKIVAMDAKQLKFPAEHIPFLFQIKEYVDFGRIKDDKLLVPKNIGPAEIQAIMGIYQESVLIYLRDLLNYHSSDFESFFKDHPNYYLISATDYVEVDNKPIPLDPQKHNYVISFPGQTMSIESFKPPSFLRSEDEIKRLLRLKS